MRRPREAGIVVLLLLGLSGCTGMPQRPSWTSTSGPVVDGAEARPSSRLLSWWRRPRTEADTEVPLGVAPEVAAPSRAGLLAGDTLPAAEMAPGRRDGLLRRLPLVGRLWGGAGRDRAEGSSLSDARPTPGPWGGEVTAASWPSPAGQPAQAVVSSGGSTLTARAQAASRRRGSAPPSSSPATAPAPAPTGVRPDPGAESSGEVALEVSGPSAGPVPEAGDQPPDVSAPRSLGDLRAELGAPAATDRAQPGTVGADRPGFGPQVDPAAIPASAPAAEAAQPPPAAPDSASRVPLLASAAADSGADASQPPPPAPPTLRRPATPPAPSATPGAEPETTPPPSPSAPTATAEENRAPTGSGPAQPGGASAGTATPAQAASPGSGPRLIATSAQGNYGYAPQPAVATLPQSRCSLLGRLCPLKKHGPLPSSQLPPIAFPTTYQSCTPGAGKAVPSPQGCNAPCECTPATKVKKPCFLKTWLHKATCPGQGCGCCGGDCDSHGPAVTASSQVGGPSTQWSRVSPQGYDATTRSWLARWAGTEPRDLSQQ